MQSTGSWLASAARPMAAGPGPSWTQKVVRLSGVT
jgi:hypothetical protein